MRQYLKTTAIAATAAIAGFVAIPTTAKAYQVDCAILLCLSGGWPASAECAHARAVFIRRITPWPVEPPLQIWRCPMGIAAGDTANPSQQLLDLAFKDAPPVMQSYPADDHYFDTVGTNRFNNPQEVSAPEATAQETITMADLRTEDGEFDALKFLQLAQDERADIDISGPEFDFVRSIRIYDVTFARQSRGREDCNRSSNVRMGSYGTQGDFHWSRSSVSALPAAHVGLEGYGRDCPRLYNRSVFVEWRDFENNYGFEQVNY